MPYTNYCELPTPYGTFRMYDTGNELFRVVTFGDINALGSKPLLRLHSSCLASEVFEAQDCDCADQLREAMKAMAHEGSGLIFHLHQEGRGQGLSKKIQAVYKMQNEALDTAESFQAMGLAQDIRDYTHALEVLNKMQVKHVRLISNNPRKRCAIESAGIKVEVINTHPQVRPENSDYLQSKNEKLGHSLPLEMEYAEDKPIYFYHSDQAWGAFSNFSKHAIYLNNKIWPTAEHFYQAQKFSDVTLQERIRTAATPILAKQLANKLSPQYLRAHWHDVKDTVMQQALTAKFTQHPNLARLLLSTKNRHIAEHTLNDSYWGDSLDGTGLNKLGDLLMKLRSDLKKREEMPACAV